MREYGVNANAGLLWLKLVDGVFRFVALFTDGEDAESGDGFKGIAGFGMAYANVHRDKVSRVKKRHGQDGRYSKAVCEYANREQANDSSNLGQ